MWYFFGATFSERSVYIKSDLELLLANIKSVFINLSSKFLKTFRTIRFMYFLYEQLAAVEGHETVTLAFLWHRFVAVFVSARGSGYLNFSWKFYSHTR